MGNNKVSENAIWEGSIPPDNDTHSIGSQMQIQPQMMFCYKCNNVIPNNSTFCPYCQIKLFTECPKCGEKYSSQYPACNNCGTNREEYLRAQRMEHERKEAIERENRRQKEAYIEGNEEIKKTKEYKDTYSLLSKAIEVYNKKNNNAMNGFGFVMFSLILMVVIPPVGAITFIISLFIMFTGTWKSREEYIMKYIQKKNDFDKEMMDRAINIVMYYGRYSLSDCCIIAYREKHKLPINYKWHN